MEIWKSINGYIGIYEVSNYGNVRTLERIITLKNGFNRKLRGKQMKFFLNKSGYLTCRLIKNGIGKTWYVHQLVCISFMNHKPNGFKLVVDHINNIKTDNKLNNLQILTNRQNVSKRLINGTSKYVGVHWIQANKKYRVNIDINGKSIYLGYHKNEYDAHIAYQNRLKEHLKTGL